MDGSAIAEFLKEAIKLIDNPWIIAAVIITVVAIVRIPDYIRAIGEVVRRGRRNKADIAREQALLEEQLRQGPIEHGGDSRSGGG